MGEVTAFAGTVPPVELDALIIGAGPAGCAAALRADELGLRVAVVDKATFPRDKTCGDGLTTQALRILDRLGVAVAHRPTCEPVQDFTVVGPDGRRLDLALPQPYGYAATITRLDLDAALVASVAARNIPMTFGDGVEHIEIDANGVSVELASGTPWRAPAVIAADGHFSRVRRLLAPTAQADLGTWHATRQYHANVATDRLWVIFERDLLPGYAWVFPLPDGRANVGFCVLRSDGHTGKEHRALWEDVMARPAIRDILGPDAQPEEPVRAWPIPCDYSPARLTHGRVLFAGDAAAVVDPMTGEGIAQALETGILAADAIAAGGGPASVAQGYRNTVDRTLGRDARFAARLSTVLASERGARWSMTAAGLNAWTRRNFARWMFEDYPRALLLTPDRWFASRLDAGNPARARRSEPSHS